MTTHFLLGKLPKACLARLLKSSVLTGIEWSKATQKFVVRRFCGDEVFVLAKVYLGMSCVLNDVRARTRTYQTSCSDPAWGIVRVCADNRLQQGSGSLDVPNLCVGANLDMAQVCQIPFRVYIALACHRVSCPLEADINHHLATLPNLCERGGSTSRCL